MTNKAKEMLDQSMIIEEYTWLMINIHHLCSTAQLKQI